MASANGKIALIFFISSISFSASARGPVSKEIISEIESTRKKIEEVTSHVYSALETLPSSSGELSKIYGIHKKIQKAYEDKEIDGMEAVSLVEKCDDDLAQNWTIEVQYLRDLGTRIQTVSQKLLWISRGLVLFPSPRLLQFEIPRTLTSPQAVVLRSAVRMSDSSDLRSTLNIMMNVDLDKSPEVTEELEALLFFDEDKHGLPNGDADIRNVIARIFGKIELSKDQQLELADKILWMKDRKTYVNAALRVFLTQRRVYPEVAARISQLKGVTIPYSAAEEGYLDDVSGLVQAIMYRASTTYQEAYDAALRDEQWRQIEETRQLLQDFRDRDVVGSNWCGPFLRLLKGRGSQAN